MGKQNFIQGGFTGKVGQLVGARWKQMHVIKAFTKSADPKTEKQQANRHSFADRVAASKLAQQANYQTTLFNSDVTTAWSRRITAASQMYGAEKNILEYVPLLPYGYAPEYPTSADPEISGQSVTLSWSTADDISGRALSVLVWAQSTTTQEYEALIAVAAVTGSAGSWTATATLPTGYNFADDTYIVAISRDSNDAENKVLYQPPVHTGAGIETVVFTLSNPFVNGYAVGDPGYMFTAATSVALPVGTINETHAVARGVLQGEWSQATQHGAAYSNGNTIDIGDFENIDEKYQRPQFVAGSTLVVPAFSFVADGKRWSFEGATFSLSETPTQQEFYDWASHTYTANAYGTEYNFDDITQVQQGAATNVPYVSNLTVQTRNMVLQQSSNGVVLSFQNTSNYWGATRDIALSTAFVFKTKGVTYQVPVGATVPLVPYQTSVTVDVAKLSVQASTYHDDDGGYSSAIIGATPDGQAASLWGSHGTPQISITANGVTRNWGTATPENSGSIFFFFGYDAPYYPASGTCTFVFPETFTESRTVANSDGFSLVLSVTAGTQTGVYTYTSD